ncbi:NACHT, LRR and PYD domains-containing protein 3-like [Cyprinus carpio]|uniref:NACHT, LRR and PYD domains-containing protein 3-like n=1 Tax=Cyprinus carpio TaxID=7962 RepID=A0A9Q9XZ37_CYPCA|nr:NACHT, LRR and PYD domains-containing protein 3-like [Cyprinus carpio]
MSHYEKKEEKDDDVHTPESAPLFNPPAISDRAVASDPEMKRDATGSVTHHLTHQTFISERDQHKINMKKKYENLFEGIKLEGNKTYLNRIYTQLYIIEGESEGVNEEHEVLQMEKTARTQHSQDTPIYCNDIFKASADQECEEKDKIKIVLTKGIAGIGKTVSVHKFILDWAEGKANQDVDFMFVLPFRELNLIQDHQYSLHRLLLDFHPELQDLDPQIYEECKVVFIFDGLDESRIKLMFSDSEKDSDVTEVSSVGMLISNLMKGELLPSALIWITSRPAAASQVPSKYIDRLTTIQGFNEPQKEEYFRKRTSDEHQASRVISHIRRARSLHIMCHIPVFCWISYTVLQKLLIEDLSAEAPQTLTEMYIHFLLTQINMRNQKYEERDPEKLLQSNREVIVKLAELAFKQLMKGNVMFYEEDLIESGLDVTDASVYSGICTEIFKKESVIHQRKVYSFIHLSFQEFLAAFYVFYSCVIKNMKSLELFLDEKYQWYCSENFIFELLKAAIDKSLQSENRHLIFFLRFLLGISLLSNQRLLLGLLRYTEDSWYSVKKTTRYIKDKMKCDETLSADRSISLFLCLLEMNDMILYQEIQEFVKSGNHSVKKLSVAYCSVIAYMLQMSEKTLDEFDLKKYNTSDEGRCRLIPAVMNCKKALLAGCRLTVECFESLSSLLQSPNSLKELDLSNSDLEDSCVKLLSDVFKSSHCQLNILRLTGCSLTAQCCESLSSALQSTDNSLRELDLSHNELQDSGVKLLSEGLKSLHCHLNILRLSGCIVTEEGCGYLASALSSNPSHLKELDLSYNNPGESGVKLLSDPKYRLDKLNVDHGGEIRTVRGPQKYACDLTLDLNTAHSHLILSESNRMVTCETKKHPYPDHPERFEGYHPQVLCRESLSGRCYWEAEWSGRDNVNISVVYKGISRKDNGSNCWFGYNKKSWSLMCFKNKYIARHNSVSTDITIPSQFNRVGVYLNWSVGTLSFYSVSDTHTLTHLHTFISTFTEPLYAGFGVSSDKSMSVWKIKQPLVSNN